jgi:hypothetical protein
MHRRSCSIVVALATCLTSVPVFAAPTADPVLEAPPTQTKLRLQRPPGHALVVTGVVFIVGSAIGYAVMAAGLGIGNRAEQDIRPLGDPEDLDRRRELLARGRLGNRMAIGAGVTSAALMAAGIPLVLVGRRRAMRALDRSVVSVARMRGGMGLSWRLRF